MAAHRGTAASRAPKFNPNLCNFRLIFALALG